MTRGSRYSFAPFVFFALALGLSTYFTFAAVQGDYGVLHRAEVSAEAARLQRRLQEVQADVALMENLTQRLSDEYLDLDLLDEQTRKILGMIRADEIVIR